MKEKEKDRERWLSVRRFNSQLFSAFNGEIFECSGDIKCWWSWDDWVEGCTLNVIDEHGGWHPVPRKTRMKTKDWKTMNYCCPRCQHKVKRLFWYLPRVLHTKEEKRYFKRETWYPLFLKEIKEHPFFLCNAHNPFIVTPRDNASIYLVINTKPL